MVFFATSASLDRSETPFAWKFVIVFPTITHGRPFT